MLNFRDADFVLQKSTNPQNKHFDVQEKWLKLCGTVKVWITVIFPCIFPRDARGDHFAKVTEECKVFDNLLDKIVENLDDHGCPKTRDVVDAEAYEEVWLSSSHPFRP